MTDSHKVHGLLQRSGFGNISGGDGDGDDGHGDGHGDEEGDGHGDGDNGDGWLVGGLQHGPVVASSLKLSALGAQTWDMQDFELILFQLYRKVNENRPVSALSLLTGATRKMTATGVSGWGDNTKKSWRSN